MLKFLNPDVKSLDHFQLLLLQLIFIKLDPYCIDSPLKDFQDLFQSRWALAQNLVCILLKHDVDHLIQLCDCWHLRVVLVITLLESVSHGKRILSHSLKEPWIMDDLGWGGG